jgi:hypothetical protein
MILHLGIMLVAALLIAAVFATLYRDRFVDQVRFAGQIVAGLVGGGIIVGVLQYIFFR